MKNIIYRLIGVILLIAAIAKVVASVDNSKALSQLDPALGVEFRFSMLIAAAVEIGVSIICLLRPVSTEAAAALLILSTNLIGYRFWMWIIGWHLPCNCMGGMSDGIGISQDTADVIMKFLLSIMFIVSTVSIWADLAAARFNRLRFSQK